MVIAEKFIISLLNLDNVFTTDYPLYKVFMYDVITPNSWFGMRARTGGASGNKSR